MLKGKEEKIEQFFTNYKAIKYNTGEIILRTGEKITQIYYIKSGAVRQYIMSPDEERLTLQLFKPHAYIPLVMFLNGEENKYTFQAIVPTEVRVAPVEDVIAFIKDNPDILFNLTTRLSQGIAGLLEKIELAGINNAYTRILSVLIHIAVRFGWKQGEEYSITLPKSHYDIASLLGMQRETVTRRMALLKKKGIIRYENEHIILVNLSEAKQELERARFQQ